MRATSTAIAAGLAAAGSSLDRRSAVVRAIAAMQFDEQRTRNCSNPGTGSELRISDAAAQTRIVSGGAVGRAKVSLSRDLNYMAGARIPEFESYHPSHADGSPCTRCLGLATTSARAALHAVGSLWVISGLQKKRGAGAQVHVRGTRARQRRAIRKGSAGDFLSWGRPSVLVC